MSTAPTLGFANYREQTPPAFHPPLQPEPWLVQVPVKKPAHRSGEIHVSWDNSKRCFSRRDATRGLDDTYVLDNRQVVSKFIAENRLHNLLVEAKEPLKERFGAATVKTLSLVSDDEGFESLVCLVTASGTLHENLNALRAFDREWWLGQINNAGGRLIFDFQLNAI